MKKTKLPRFVKAKSGHVYVYAWRGGPRVATFEPGQTPTLSREIRTRIAEAWGEANTQSENTLDGLIRDWRRSPQYKALAPNTRATWEVPLARIADKWGKFGLELWNDPRMVGKVVAWRDGMADTPRAADIGITVLSRVLEWGRLRARVKINVATGIPNLYHGADRSEIIWTPDDEDAFCRSALMMDRLLILDALDLASWTGFRLADLAAVTFAECGQEAIIRRAAKKSRGRRRRAAVPILAPLKALIDDLRTRPRAHGVDTLLVNSLGKPWSSEALGKRFAEVRDHAGIKHLGEHGEPDRPKHLHDVRGTYVTHLCRAGLTDDEVASIVAWSPQNVARIRRVYVDDAAVVVSIGRRLAAQNRS